MCGHTDAPNLRVKPRPDLARLGWDQLALEVYGGPLLNSWLDRDLGLSGRVLVRDPGTAYGARALLWRHDEPLLRIPQLAIHLARGVTEPGLTLNPQTHLVPVSYTHLDVYKRQAPGDWAGRSGSTGWK